MEWRDQGILLTSRSHGETSAIIDVFTPGHGRHAGVVRGGASRKMAAILQPGAQLDLVWRARLEDHIGSFGVEPIRSRAAMVLNDRRSLAGFNAVTGLLIFALPERLAYPRLYARTQALLDLLDQPNLWPLAYVQWELFLLEELGFGLDLSSCAVLDETDEDLAYISPRTGRAVSKTGAGDWADRLLPLPAAFTGASTGEDADIHAALQVTGHFLTNHLAAGLGNKPLPAARSRFAELFKTRP